MNALKTSLIFVPFIYQIMVACVAEAQGTFQDLDFESANLAPIADGQWGGMVPITAALPGWTGYIGSVQQTQVLHNLANNSTEAIAVIGPYWGPVNQSTFSIGIINGNCTAYLESGSSVATSIAQIGTIPATAQSLTFDVFQRPFALPLAVSFGGNILSPLVLSAEVSPSGQPYNVYGVDIAPYAGQTGQLEFTVYPNNYNSALLDDINFSPTAIVPEPSPVILSGIGGLIFALHRRLRQQSA